MGEAMVNRLLKAGHPVSVWNRTAAKAEPLVEYGETIAASKQALSSCDVVFTMVSTTDDLKEVLFSAGGFGKQMGQSFVAENKTGSGTLIGTDVVAKSTPDGYTLLTGSISNIALNPGLYRILRYDSLKDFEPLGLAVNCSYTLNAEQTRALVQRDADRWTKLIRDADKEAE
jgi:hypothetical protein